MRVRIRDIEGSVPEQFIGEISDISNISLLDDIFKNTPMFDNDEHIEIMYFDIQIVYEKGEYIVEVLVE